MGRNGYASNSYKSKSLYANSQQSSKKRFKPSLVRIIRNGTGTALEQYVSAENARISRMHEDEFAPNHIKLVKQRVKIRKALADDLPPATSDTTGTHGADISTEAPADE